MINELPPDWLNLRTDETINRLMIEVVDESILSTLVDSPDWEVRRAVALNPGATDALLSVLREKDQDNYIDAVIKQRELPATLRGNNEETIELVRGLDLDEDLQLILAQSDESSIRASLASNPYATQGVLELLSEDDDFDVQDSVFFRGLPSEWTTLDSFRKGLKIEEDPESVTDDMIILFAQSHSSFLQGKAKKLMAARGLSSPDTTTEKTGYRNNDDDDLDVSRLESLSDESREILFNSMAVAGLEAP